jgi:hypothetical protein
MFRPTLGAGALVLAVLAASARLPAQDKAPPAKKTGPAAKEKLYPIGVYAGKVLNIEDDGKVLQMRVYGQTATPRFTPGNPRS